MENVDTTDELLEASTVTPLPWERPVPPPAPPAEDGKVKQTVVEPPHNSPYLRAETHFERMKPQDRILREAFVTEYMFDYNPLTAAFRVGFKGASARAAAKRLMNEPGVQRLIRERMQAFDAESMVSAERILAGLLKEATREGPGSSHAARVGAWTNLAKIVGAGGPEDEPGTIKIQGGVMIVPASPATAEDWEKGASASQAQLKRDVTA